MTEGGQSLPGSPAVVPAARAEWPAARLLSSSPLPILLLSMLALRCWVVGRTDLEADEAYYWLWSRQLAPSYFDHPPMVAYLIRLGTLLLGDTIPGLRSMAILALIVSSALVYALAVILFDNRRTGLLAVLWFNMMPLTAFFSIILFPDTPALMFWLLSCVGLSLVWRSGRGEWWYLVGAATGLLLLSKYTGIFLVAGIAAWLLLSAEMRPWLARREPYIAALIALLIFTPVILWNARHGWVSFGKQFGRAMDVSTEGGLANMLGFVGTQAAFVSPLIFAFSVAGVALAAVRGWRSQEAGWLLLALTSAPMLLYFLVHALSAEVLPNWPSAAYPAAVVAAVAVFSFSATGPPRRNWIGLSFEAAPWVGLALTLILCTQMTVQPMPIAAARDPLSRFAGWAGLSSETRAIADAQGASYVATNDYGLNAALAFYLRDLTVFQTSESIRYASLPPLDQALLARAAGIYVTTPALDDFPRMQKHFDSVELIATIWRSRKGDPIQPYRIYRLKGYRGGLPSGPVVPIRLTLRDGHAAAMWSG
jgi:4-amino-4-deoxy-L-arabinose transferase-like glycosyltransferase